MKSGWKNVQVLGNFVKWRGIGQLLTWNNATPKVKFHNTCRTVQLVNQSLWVTWRWYGNLIVGSTVDSGTGSNFFGKKQLFTITGNSVPAASINMLSSNWLGLEVKGEFTGKTKKNPYWVWQNKCWIDDVCLAGIYRSSGQSKQGVDHSEQSPRRLCTKLLSKFKTESMDCCT